MAAPMRRAKSIDELFGEVKGFDLVIVPDDRLAEALNARYGRPRVEPWCMTPRAIARKIAIEVLGEPLIDDMQLVRSISEDTGIGDLRFILGEVDSIREMLRYTSDPSAFIHSRRSRKVLESFLRQPVIERVMKDFESVGWGFYSRHMRRGSGIAVVGVDLYDMLGRFMLPYDPDRNDIYAEIDPFTDEPFVIETIYEVGNDRLVAENAADLIPVDDADRFAVIVRKGSGMETALRSSLCRRGIPVQESPTALDLGDIRDFLSFADLALDADTIRVRHVRSLFARYGGRFEERIDEHLLTRVARSSMYGRSALLRDAMADIRGMTFGKLADILLKGADRHVSSVLAGTGMRDEPITERAVATLRYLVENIDLDTGDEDDAGRGVLIADSSASIWIDRPVVIVLGMDSDWDPDFAGKRYLEPRDEAERDAIRCQIMLQQGDSRFLLVDASRDGERASPSSVFGVMARMDDSGGRMPETFDDLLPGEVETTKARWTDGKAGLGLPDRVRLAPEGERFEHEFSKSTFNSFMECPHKFVLSRAVGTDASTDMELGNLVHSFAELCAVHPEIVEERGLEHFVQRLAEEYSGISSPTLGRIDTDRIRMELAGIRDFLRHIGVRIEELDKEIDGKDNPLFFEEGLEMSSTVCEKDRGSDIDPIHGKFDLYWNGVVYDYKSGKRKALSKVASVMCPDSGQKYLDFQPMIYLLISSMISGSARQFTLFYPYGDGKEVSSDGRVEGNMLTVRVVDGNADGLIRQLIQEVAEDPKNLGRSVREEEFARMTAAISEHYGSEDPVKWRPNNDDVRKEICLKAGLPFKSWNKVFGKYIDICKQKVEFDGLFYTKAEVLIPEDTLERFRHLLAEKHEALITGSVEGYDLGSRTVKCSDCDYRSLCTLTKDNAVEVDDGGDSDE